jgi:hypothetical protein
MTDSRCETNKFGTKRWFDENGELHRLDGPAVEWRHGSKAWWVNGKRHRLDGPATELASNFKEWYVNDKELTKEEFEQHPLVVFYRLCKEHV